MRSQDTQTPAEQRVPWAQKNTDRLCNKESTQDPGQKSTTQSDSALLFAASQATSQTRFYLAATPFLSLLLPTPGVCTWASHHLGSAIPFCSSLHLRANPTSKKFSGQILGDTTHSISQYPLSTHSLWPPFTWCHLSVPHSALCD